MAAAGEGVVARWVRGPWRWQVVVATVLGLGRRGLVAERVVARTLGAGRRSAKWCSALSRTRGAGCWGLEVAWGLARGEAVWWLVRGKREWLLGGRRAEGRALWV